MSVNTPIQHFIESVWAVRAPFDNWPGSEEVTLAPGSGSGSDMMTGDSSQEADGRTEIYLHRHMLDIFYIFRTVLFRLTIVDFSPPLQWGEITLSILIALTNIKRRRKEKLRKCLIFIFVCWFSLSQFWS